MLNGKTFSFKAGGDFTPLEEGVYQVQVVDVNLIENVITTYAPEGKDMLEFKFAVLDEGSRGRFLWHRMTPSLNSKATMAGMVKAVLGHVPSADEVSTFNPETLIGKQVQAVVVQNPSSDGSKIWNNIQSYVKANKELPKWDSEVVEKASKPLDEAAVEDILKDI